MKKLIPLSRIAAAIGLFGALAASTSVFTASNRAIGSQSSAIQHPPLGVIETDGTLDLPFDAGSFANGWVTDAALQPDGKLLVAGPFSTVHGVTRHGIARLNTDGTLDLSFDPGVGPNFGVTEMALQPDGKIIILGPFDTISGVDRFAGIARLNSNGSLDLTFDPGRGISIDGIDDGNGNAISPGRVESVVLQANGKIVVTGNFFYIIPGPGTKIARSCVARFNSDGSFDPTYDPGDGFVNTSDPDPPHFNTRALRSALESSGKIIVQGAFDTFDGQPVPGLVRLNTDGSLDNAFAPGPTTEPFVVRGLFVQSNDRIVIFGSFTSFGGVPCSGIVRLNNSGALDGTFSTPPFANYGTGPIIEAVAQQADGKLIVGGFFHSLGGSEANNLARLEANGARDASFSATAAGPSGYQVGTILVRPSDGKIFVGGYFSTFGGAPRNNMAWLNSDGSVDSSFAGLAGVTDYGPQIYALATQADDKIVAGGFFSSFNGTPHNNLVRLNPDSTIDPSFDGTLGTEGSVRAMLTQPDGKILIAGNVRAVNGVARGSIARLNSNGTLDPSFDPGAGANSTIYALALDASGNVYVGGSFSTINGLPRLRVAKLGPTGALDPTFNQSGGGANGIVYAMVSPDGAGGLVIGGAFTTYDGASARRIARVDVTTGALDPGFNFAGTSFNSTVYALQRGPEGKYYAGGTFNSFNGATRSRVARLGSDGSLDETFVGPAMDGTVATLALQNGKVFVGGRFFTLQPSQVVRLTGSGALDPTFVPGTGIGISPANTYPLRSPEVSTLAIQSDGKLLLGGIFNRYNGTTRICLARLTGPSVPPTPTPTPSATPSPTPSATPSPTATPTPSPTAIPTTLGNISTRLRVETGDNVLIGGFIVTGTQPKTIIVRALGPSLSLAGALDDPVLELRDSSGVLIMSNDNWRTGGQEAEIIATTIPPSNDLESALVATLPANGSAYTAIVRGVANGTGIGVVEAYDLDRTVNSKLANISTRGFVQTGDNVLIGGLIVLGRNPLSVIVRAIGPSLPLSGALSNPSLDLHDGNGALIVSNDNWRTGGQESEIIATGIPPANDLESAIVRNLTPGNYTAIVRGVNNTTGIAVVEAYGLN